MTVPIHLLREMAVIHQFSFCYCVYFAADAGMDTIALNRLTLELHKLNVQRWFKLPRIQQIFRTIGFTEPKLPEKFNEGADKVNVQGAEHTKGQDILQQLQQQPIMGNMQIPKNMQSMVKGYLSRFKSTSRLLSETLKAAHPGMLGRGKGAEKGMQRIFLAVIFQRGMISLDLPTLKKTKPHTHRRLLFRIRRFA